MSRTPGRPSDHVTVVLSVFNGADYVTRAVRSIAAQSHDDFDLVVVDDCSKDDTFELLLPLARADARIRLVRLHENVGTYAAKNLVLKHYASGPFFAHQDADDESAPDRLTRQVEFLSENPEFAACGTAIDEIFEDEADHPRIPSDADVEYDSSAGLFRRTNRYPERLEVGEHFAQPLGELSRIKLAMNGSLMFRTETLRKLGGYDGHARVAGDTELLWRILQVCPVANLQEAYYARRFHVDSLTRSEQFGFGSDIRRQYIEKVRERLIAHATAEPTRPFVQEMYVPDVAFDVVG